MKNILLAIAALGMVAHAPAGVWAAEAEPAKEWDPVVVTASRVPEKLANVTAAMTVIPQEEIQKQQYTDLPSLLRNYGVQINDYGPNQNLTQIALRGKRASLFGQNMQSGVLLLMDGRRLGTTNISMIPMTNIERVEILRGPAAVQYGAVGIGGVINVITRRGGEEFHAGAEAGLGSFSQWQTQGYVSGMAGPFDFSVGGLYTSSENYWIGGDSHKMYDNTALGYKRGVSANLGFNFFEQHRLGVIFTSQEINHAGTPSYIDDLHRTSYTDRTNYSIDVLYEGGYKDWGLSWMARYYTGEEEYTAVDTDITNPDSYWMSLPHYRAHMHYEGTQAQLSWTNGMFTLTGGADWARQALTGDDYLAASFFNIPPWGGFYTESMVYGNRSTFDSLGLFLLAKLSLFDDQLIITGGLRNDDYLLGFDGTSKDLHHLSPTLGMAWHATDWLTLKANYGTAYTLPDPHLFVGGIYGGSRYLANHDLKAEKSYGWDAGFEVAHKGLRLGLTYFESVTIDKVVQHYFMDENVTKAENAEGSLWLKGLEGHASFDLGEFFEWPFTLRPYVNFTHIFPTSCYNDQNDPDGPIPYVNDWDIAYGINFNHPGWGTNVDIRATYFGRQRVKDFDPMSHNYNNFVHIGNKTVVDIFLSQRLWKDEKLGEFSVVANVRNLFNEKYALQKGYPMPGRSFYVGVKWEF